MKKRKLHVLAIVSNENLIGRIAVNLPKKPSKDNWAISLDLTSMVYPLKPEMVTRIFEAARHSIEATVKQSDLNSEEQIKEYVRNSMKKYGKKKAN